MKERMKDTMRKLLGHRTASSGPTSGLQQLIAGGLASVGEGTYGDPEVFSWGSSTRLTIGAYCSIGQGVRILLGGEHRTEWATTSPLRVLNDLPGAWEDGHPNTKGDIAIGNDVWIATGVMILSGVTIGDGVVIGAGTVVASDIPAYAIIRGNPASIIRYRFPEQERAALARIAWWDWPHEDVLAQVDLLCSPDVTGFIEKFDPQPD